MGRRPFSRFLFLTLALLPLVSASALDVPFLVGRVNDLAGLLSPEEKERIEASLESLEEQTGAQLVVLTIPSLEGENLEDFSLRVAEQWQLGQAEADNGVLLLIARDDRELRLEVGYGLEGTLPDALCRRVLDDVIVPRFRQGEFGGGIEAGTTAVAALIQGDESVLPAVGSGGDNGLPPWPVRILISLFVLGIVSVFATVAVFTKGGESWMLYVFLLPFLTLFPGVLLGFRVAAALGGLWIVGFPILRVLLWRTAWGKGWRKGSPWARRLEATAFTSGGGRGGFSRRSSSSGSSFSGGGGSFGGGGASSGW